MLVNDVGEIKVTLDGKFEDISRIYEFMKYHTKEISEPKWFSQGDRKRKVSYPVSDVDCSASGASKPPTSVEYTVTI